MRTVTTAADLRAARADLPEPVGFVPTMGALHAGHMSLVERARRECASVIVSVFVNPLQFAPNEDFERYPRTPEEDSRRLQAAGVDVLFAPSRAEMYPPGAQFVVTPGPIAAHLEGERRPGFFSGVATVVLKLFNLIRPHVAYFGRKDAQQLAVVTRMVVDFDMPIEVRGCTTLREPDGLAMSSRNAYLNESERREAVRLHKALIHIADALAAGARDVAVLLREAEAELPPLKRDYLAVVDPGRFEPLQVAPAGAQLLVLGAAFAGATRLIDNVDVSTPGVP